VLPGPQKKSAKKHPTDTATQDADLPIIAEIEVDHDDAEYDDLHQELFERRRRHDRREVVFRRRGGRRCRFTGGRRSNAVAASARRRRIGRRSAPHTHVYFIDILTIQIEITRKLSSADDETARHASRWSRRDYRHAHRRAKLHIFHIPQPELTLGQWVRWVIDLDGSHGPWVTVIDPQTYDKIHESRISVRTSIDCMVLLVIIRNCGL